MNDNLPLYLNDIIKNYLELLKSQGMNKEQMQVEDLVKYIDKLDFQFNELLTEIKEIHNTLNAIQNPQTKSIMRKSVEGIENTVIKGKQEAQEIKSFVKTTIYDAVASFKEKGKEALLASTKILKIKSTLESVRKSLFFVSNWLDRGSLNCNELTNEFRKAKQSFKNVGLLMVGKRPNHDIDTTKVNIIQKGLQSMKEKSNHMTAKTSDMICRLSEYQKSSVRKDLKDISSSEKKVNSIPKKNKEKAIR